MSRTLLMLTTVVVAFAAGPVAADVYKFKDDHGNILYTDKPSTLPAERLNIQSNKTDTVAVQAREEQEAKRQQEAAKATQQAAAGQANQQAANPGQDQQQQPSATDKAEQCTKARQRYDTYMSSQRLYQPGADGQRKYLSDDELTAARASAKASMDVMCK